MKALLFIFLLFSFSSFAEEAKPHPWVGTFHKMNPFFVCRTEQAINNIWDIHKSQGLESAQPVVHEYMKAGICGVIPNAVLYVDSVDDVTVVEWGKDGHAEVAGHLMHVFTSNGIEGWGLFFMFMDEYRKIQGDLSKPSWYSPEESA